MRFSSSEFMLRHGFVDMIVHRRNMKGTLSYLLEIYDSTFNDNVQKTVFKIENMKNKSLYFPDIN